jgi:hypothetical protein
MIVTRAPSPGAIVLALVEGRPVPTSAPATVVPVWHSPRMGALMADAPILKAHDGIGRPSDHAREALGTMGKHGRIKVAAAHRAPAETVRPWRGAHGDVVLNREASLTSLMDPTRNHYGRDKGANAWTATTESDALRPYSLLLALADVHTHDAPGRNGLAVDWSALAVTLDMPETTVRPWVAAMVAARFAVGTTVTQSGAASTAASRAKALGKRGIGTDGFRDAVATARTHGDGFRRIRAERVAILSPARNVGIANASPAKGWHAAGKVARARHGLIAKFGGFGSPAIARPNVTVATAGRRVRIARPDGTAVTI